MELADIEDFHRRYQMRGTKTKPNGEVMTIRELAAYMRVHATTLYRLVRQGQIPSFKIGSEWRFLKSEIDRYARGEWQPQVKTEGDR